MELKTYQIKDLKEKPYFVEHIRWDISPKVFVSPHISSGDSTTVTVDTTYGYMLYVDLVYDKPAIIIMQLKELMSNTIGYIDEAPEDLLKEAMQCTTSECVAGMYPLTEELETWLKEQMGVD